MLHVVQLTTLLLICYIGTQVAGQADNVKIPAELLATALNHVSHSSKLDAAATIQSLNLGDIDTIYEVAKDMNEAGDLINSVLIWHILADGNAHHILSMVSLGFSYSEQDKQQAIKYFVQAGEDGPHQSSLYNAGRMFVENNLYVQGLAYIRAAATLGDDKMLAEYTKSQMTATATKAYQHISRMMLAENLSVESMVNIFPYASIDGFPQEGSKEDMLWNRAMQKLEEYANTEKLEAMQLARKDISRVQDSKELSQLQEKLLSKLLMQTLNMILNEL
jgi:hypothetical protein